LRIRECYYSATMIFILVVSTSGWKGARPVQFVPRYPLLYLNFIQDYIAVYPCKTTNALSCKRITVVRICFQLKYNIHNLVLMLVHLHPRRDNFALRVANDISIFCKDTLQTTTTTTTKPLMTLCKNFLNFISLQSSFVAILLQFQLK
jgi:hypothetical protein